MLKTVLNVKTDQMLKENAQAVAKMLGLPLGTIVNHYLRELVAQKQVTFAVYPAPNKKTQKLLKQASADYRKGKNLAGPFKTAKAMDTYLDA
jgi:addiction module RelB/DinJ family antitoxin